MVVNKARFKIDASPSEDPTTGDRGVDVTPGQTIAITLEQNPARVLSVKFSLPSDDDEESPYRSTNETPQLFDENSESSITSTDVNATFHVTIDPATEMSSYVIRCETVDDQGTHIYERMISVRGADLRMTVPAERQEYGNRGWSDAMNEMALAIAALVAGGAGLIVTGTPTLNDTIKWNGTTAVWASPSALPNMSTDRILGRDTAGTGQPEELALDATLAFTGSGSIGRAALTGDVTAAAGSNATTIAPQAVTFTKIQNITANRLLGRNDAVDGTVEEIALNSTLEWTGSNSIQRAALTGAITAPAGSNVTTLGTGVVTLASMANMNTDRLLGRDTAGLGAPEEISLGGGLEWTGTGSFQRSAFTGDVTAAAGGTVLTLGNGVINDINVNATAGIAFTKLATIATDRLLGRDTAATGALESIGVTGGIEFTGTGNLQRSALTGDVTAAAGSNTTAIAPGVIVDNDVSGTAAIALTKLQNITTDRILGRDTAGTGAIEQLTVSNGLEFTGTGIQRSALIGDVTAPAGSNTTTIAPGAITFAKMANMSTDRLLGRDTAGSGVPEEIAVGGGLEFTGSTSIQRSALTGAISASAGSNTTAFASGNFGALNITTTGFIGLGTNPSATGQLRLPNATFVNWRNAANTADIVGIGVNASDDVVIGDSADTAIVVDASGDTITLITGGAPRFSVNNTTASFSGIGINATFFSVGTTPAATGGLRMPNNVGINWRNAANSADIQGIIIDNSNRLVLGDGTDTYIRVDASADDIRLVLAGSTQATFGTNLADFAAASVRTTGTYRAGTNPATSGAYNIPNATTAVAGRNAANSADLQMLRVDSSDTISLGDPTGVGIRLTFGGTIGARIGGVDQLTLTSSSLIIVPNVVSLGTTPATTGLFRIPSATGVFFRNNANTANITLISTNSSDGVFIADTTAPSVSINTSGARLIIGTNLEIQNSSQLRFDFAVATPSIIHEADATIGITGDLFLVQAQNVTGTGSTVGGIFSARGGDSTFGVGGGIDLRSGAGASAVQAGDFTMRVGASIFFNYAGAGVPALTGVFRASHNSIIMAGRNNANSLDINLIRWGTTANDTLVIGDGGVPVVFVGSTTTLGDSTDTWVTTSNAANTVTVGAGGAIQAVFGATTVDFQNNNLFSTGTLSLGTSPSSSGTIGLPSLGTIQFRNAANSGNVLGLSVGSADEVRLGNTGAAGYEISSTTHSFRVGGVDQLTLTATTANFQDNAIVTTGNLSIGTTPSTTGNIRIAHNVIAISGRDSTNANNRSIVRWGTTTNTSIFGDTAVNAELNGAQLDLKLAATTVYTATTTGITYTSPGTNPHTFKLGSNERFGITDDRLFVSNGGLTQGTVGGVNYPFLTWVSTGTAQVNIGLLTAGSLTPNYNGGAQVLYIGKNVTVPSSNPTNGIYAWVRDNASDGKFGLVTRSDDGVMRLGNAGVTNLELSAVAMSFGASTTLAMTGTTVSISSTSLAMTGIAISIGNGSSNVELFGSAASFGGGVGVLAIRPATTSPTTAPADGVLLYTEGAQLIVKKSGGGAQWDLTLSNGSLTRLLQNGSTFLNSTSAGQIIATIDTSVFPSNCSGVVKATVLVKNGSNQGVGATCTTITWRKNAGTLQYYTSSSEGGTGNVGTASGGFSGSNLYVTMTPSSSSLLLYYALMEITYFAW